MNEIENMTAEQIASIKASLDFTARYLDGEPDYEDEYVRRHGEPTWWR